MNRKPLYFIFLFLGCYFSFSMEPGYSQDIQRHNKNPIPSQKQTIEIKGDPQSISPDFGFLNMFSPESSGDSELGFAGQDDSLPVPLFPSQAWRETWTYNPQGICLSHEMGKDIWNTGAAGNVFVSVTKENVNETFSKVFHMEPDELVIVWISLPCYETGELTITARAATPQDTSYGSLRVECPECKADFTASPTEGVASLEVHFSNKSSLNVGETSWGWMFGDGTFGYDKNSIHVYEKPGNYTVSLTATCLHGSISMKLKENLIRVYPKETLGDTDQDGDVDGEDLAEFAKAFGSSSGEENFNPACDVH